MQGPCENGTIRLVERVSEREGAVEICVNNLWHTVLDSQEINQLQEASVICSQLGFSPVGKNIHEALYITKTVCTCTIHFYFFT